MTDSKILLCRITLFLLILSGAAAPADAHTLLHLGLFSTSRTVELYPDHLLVRYKSTLTSSLETSTSVMIVDTNGDGRLDSGEKDGVSTASMEYLAMDLTIFLDRDQLDVTTQSESVFDNLKGFELVMKAAVPPRRDGLTTQALTIIDPAYAFPPLDPDATVPPTIVICHGSQYADSKDHAVKNGEVPSESSTVIPWNRSIP